MNKEFILYEQALELKKLGFDEPCFGFYLKNQLELNIGFIKNDRIYNENSNGNSLVGYGKSLIYAPLYQQAFRWFREKYNIISEIKNWNGFENNKWFHQIHYNNKLLPWNFNKNTSYEEAELACLKELIEIITNNQ